MGEFFRLLITRIVSLGVHKEITKPIISDNKYLICDFKPHYLVYLIATIVNIVILSIVIFMGVDLVIIISFVIILAFTSLLTFMFKMYYLEFNENIYYRNWFGMVRKYEYKDIDFVSSETGYFKVNMKDGFIIKVNSNKYEIDFYRVVLNKESVILKTDSIDGEFVMQITKEYKLVFKLFFGFCFLILFGLSILSIFDNDIIVFLIILILMIFSVVLILQVLNKKIIVRQDEIEIIKFLSKPKKYLLSEISGFKINSDNISNILVYLYLNNKKIGSYSMNDENANLFDQVLKKYKIKEIK